MSLPFNSMVDYPHYQSLAASDIFPTSPVQFQPASWRTCLGNALLRQSVNLNNVLACLQYISNQFSWRLRV